MNKRNVIATAISEYRIRKSDFKDVNDNKVYSHQKRIAEN
jgi:predicted nucleic-acid-binding protein